jgi:hypothetical protein
LKRLINALFIVALLFAASASHAARRPPGPYSGVIIFDRWGGCVVYNGPEVMYVSEKIKARLYPYEGKAIQILATKVYQPDDSDDDGRIDDFNSVGPPSAGESWLPVAGLTLKSALDASRRGIVIAVSNTGQMPLRVDRGELTPIVFTKQTPTSRKYSLADGPSCAMFLGESFWNQTNDVARDVFGNINKVRPCMWSVDLANSPSRYFTLGPHETRLIQLMCDLPMGEYDFFCGYGGWAAPAFDCACLCSNLTAFNVSKDGQLAGNSPKSK